MSMEYWTIEGVGLCTDDIRIDFKKLREFLRQELINDRDSFPELWDSAVKDEDIDLGSFLYGTVYNNFGDLLTFCDDTDTLTFGDDGDGVSYFYYPPSMPWAQGIREPSTLRECKENIVRAVRRISSMTEREILDIIDENLYVVGMG